MWIRRVTAAKGTSCSRVAISRPRASASSAISAGSSGEGAAELHDHGRCAGLTQLANVASAVDRRRAEPGRSREQDFAAAQKARDVGDLAGVHPADRPVDLLAWP